MRCGARTDVNGTGGEVTTSPYVARATLPSFMSADLTTGVRFLDMNGGRGHERSTRA
jgi:hypothetical protein